MNEQDVRIVLNRLPAEVWNHLRAVHLNDHSRDCIRWIEPIFGTDEFDMDPAAYKPFGAKSVAALLETFDGEVAKAKQVMSSAADRR